MRIFLYTLLLATCSFKGRSQTFIATDSIGSNSPGPINYIRTLFEDSLSSSFCIVIKTDVKAHKHAYHSEHVVVLEGEGLMTMKGKNFVIKKGDLVFIPKNSVHAVRSTGSIPLKVLSIQAPLFNGSDRIFVSE